MTEKQTPIISRPMPRMPIGARDLRPYFAYRDLGIKDATEGRVLAHVIRAEQPCAGPMG